jgi:hypothetical protein
VLCTLIRDCLISINLLLKDQVMAQLSLLADAYPDLVGCSGNLIVEVNMGHPRTIRVVPVFTTVCPGNKKKHMVVEVDGLCVIIQPPKCLKHILKQVTGNNYSAVINALVIACTRGVQYMASVTINLFVLQSMCDHYDSKNGLGLYSKFKHRVRVFNLGNNAIASVLYHHDLVTVGGRECFFPKLAEITVPFGLVELALAGRSISESCRYRQVCRLACVVSRGSSLTSVVWLRFLSILALNRNMCWWCRRDLQKSPTNTLCGNCRVARFCNSECARKSWGTPALNTLCRSLAWLGRTTNFKEAFKQMQRTTWERFEYQPACFLDWFEEFLSGCQAFDWVDEFLSGATTFEGACVKRGNQSRSQST